ncbi:hypothetical protein K2F54_05295 [Cryobacterium sp. 1639]|uniref:hypothetical protein n=1 Tax=Cryobacterium inferilacus TaxID=2866629 RepID=UPI001C737BC5|nr:hypothetical protein [Cryobacterium sp. 1639]MBX0299391.1 hypothetical protein [Cryobacterium sp. 1639]
MVQIEGVIGEGGGYDEQGYPIEDRGILASVPAHVFYSTSGLEIGSTGVVVTDELRCIIEPPAFDILPGQHRIIWRGDYHQINGRLVRSKSGRIHHLTLNLARAT